MGYMVPQLWVTGSSSAYGRELASRSLCSVKRERRLRRLSLGPDSQEVPAEDRTLHSGGRTGVFTQTSAETKPELILDDPTTTTRVARWASCTREWSCFKTLFHIFKKLVPWRTPPIDKLEPESRSASDSSPRIGGGESG
ncbi:hypothetical protein B0H17DRAFT_1337852 [Mycena rosella]|uniref:Uncharacterized protein n=1 Tax=Mycena rosella TaxID=1033263 RepID=A0AAD7G1V6_MYCRO|nr:hypothetical protein B0H17DRAFT_1337852 [Mycena rosella]